MINKNNAFSVIGKVLNLIFVWLIIWFLLVAIFKKEWIEFALETLKNVVQDLWNWNFVIILLISIIESFPVIWVVVPGQQAMLIVGWVFWSITLIPVIICASIWALIWNYVWFYLWKEYWDVFFKKYWNWIWIWITELQYLKKSTEKSWWLFVIFWKFHNTTRSFIPFIAGWMWMQNNKFWIYNFIWSVLWSTVIIILWTMFVKHYKEILNYIEYIFLWFFVFLWIYIYFFKKKEFKKYLQDKEKEWEEIL